MSQQSSVSVLTSVGIGAGLTTFKLIAAALSGSAGVLAEGIHSLVDTVNSALLYLGQRLSKVPPDEEHQFGHGMELYFWTLVVAMLLFVLGGLASIGEGVSRLISPPELNDVGWSFAALGTSFVLNSITWVVAFREFRSGQGRKTFMEALHKSKDPSLLTVLFEDTASIAGVVVAAAGLGLAKAFDRPEFDAIASIIVGALLCIVGYGLVRQCKKLLLGESGTEELTKSVRDKVTRNPAVADLVDLRSMHLSSDDILVAMKLRFKANLPAQDVAHTAKRLEDAIRDDHPECQHIYIAAAE
jgi:cation diffusion facilitator family transporter